MSCQSKYNLYISNEKDEFVLFNGLSRKMIKTSLENKNKLMDFLKNPDENVPLYNLFECNSFIVSDNEMEQKDVENKYMELCHSNRTLHVIILPTYQCNFRCAYCYETFPDIRMQPQVCDEVYAFVEKKLQDYSSLEVSWFGGEPLLELETIVKLSTKFRDLCKRLGKVYLASITTNGYLLDCQTFKMLLKSNVRTYQITIDGTENMHNKYRHLIDGEPTYNVIISNLKKIRDEVKSSMFQIVIRTNLTKELVGEGNSYFKFIEEEFLCDPRFKHVCRIAFAYKNESLHEKLLNTDNLINSSFYSLPNGVIDEDNRNYFIESFKDFLRGDASVCYAGKESSFVIDPIGKLMKCTVCLDDEKNYIGNIFEGIDTEQFKSWVIRPNDSDVKKMCFDCPIYPICMNVSCPYEHFSSFGRKRQSCVSKIKDVMLYIKVLSHDSSICENIDSYFASDNRKL